MPGTRFKLTPLYDVLTAQPSVDAYQVGINKFKLAMSVGKNNHYKINDITPRHFLQTADRCAFDKTKLIGEFEQLMNNGEKAATSMMEGLPHVLPAQLMDSVLTCVAARIRSISLWAEKRLG
jgi:serine/threonine-protein kinase HipA